VGYDRAVVRYFTDRRCLLHHPGRGFPESPERLLSIVAAFDDEGRKVPDLGDHPRSELLVERVHDPLYVERFRRAVERGDGLLDSADNPLSPGTWSAAWGAVHATLHAVDWVAQGRRRTAFAAVRPPGHHAERGVAMGFCFFANIVIAAEALIELHGLSRLAIFDFDVHHGNGTQHLLDERGDVLYVSTHRYPFYPGTGAAGERGHGPGLGATLNIPLPVGTGDEGYERVIDETVLPALVEFGPECLLVSAGFDAWKDDPIGGMRVSEAGFESWGRKLGAFAREHCDGHALAILEGGYDLAALPDLVIGFSDALSAG